MKKGTVEIICGHGRGKTALAIGKGIQALTEQKEVIMIQFLKGCARREEMEVLRALEPDFKIFRFEKADAFFEKLTEEEKAEEQSNIRNGFHFARKVIATGECSLLILDEVLGLVNQGIVAVDEFLELLRTKDDQMDLILTGTDLPEAVKPFADRISMIDSGLFHEE